MRDSQPVKKHYPEGNNRHVLAVREPSHLFTSCFPTNTLMIMRRAHLNWLFKHQPLHRSAHTPHTQYELLFAGRLSDLLLCGNDHSLFCLSLCGRWEGRRKRRAGSKLHTQGGHERMKKTDPGDEYRHKGLRVAPPMAAPVSEGKPQSVFTRTEMMKATKTKRAHSSSFIYGLLLIQLLSLVSDRSTGLRFMWWRW